MSDEVAWCEKGNEREYSVRRITGHTCEPETCGGEIWGCGESSPSRAMNHIKPDSQILTPLASTSTEVINCQVTILHLG